MTALCNCTCAATVARLEEDLHSAVARISELEIHKAEVTTRMDEFSARLGAVQSSVDRCVSAVLQQTAASREATSCMQRVESKLEMLVRQQTPSVEVSHG